MRRNDGRAVAGHNDLAAMRVPAQDQADATVAYVLNEVGIV
jgi:hypothetical protein